MHFSLVQVVTCFPQVFHDAARQPQEAGRREADHDKEAGKPPSEARLREHDINIYVARDPDKAWDEIVPGAFYMREAYAQRMNESSGDYDMGDVVLKAMTMEEYRESGILTIMTPKRAIAHFEDMLAQGPVEHFMMSVPPGVPLSRFRDYAELFANEVMPPFA